MSLNIKACAGVIGAGRVALYVHSPIDALQHYRDDQIRLPHAGLFSVVEEAPRSAPHTFRGRTVFCIIILLTILLRGVKTTRLTVQRFLVGLCCFFPRGRYHVVVTDPAVYRASCLW